MLRRAKVTLAGDPLGMHARPAGEIARQIAGIDARIVFSRGDRQVEINTQFPTLDLMSAAAALALANGASFEISCEGPDSQRAMEALGKGFTGGSLEGSTFELLGQASPIASL